MSIVLAVFTDSKYFQVIARALKNPVCKLLYVVVAAMCAEGLLAGAADANVGLRICPSNIVFETPAGFSETKIIKVSNCGSETIAAKADIVDVIKSANGKIIYRERPIGNDPDAGWLKITPERFKLKPESSMYVKATTTVPLKAFTGKRYCAVRFGASDPEGSRINVVGNVVSSITLISQGKTAAQFEAHDFSTGGVNVGSPVEFVLNVRNCGKTYYRTSGKLEIRTMSNKPVSAFNLPKVTIPPDSIKELKVETKATLPIGIYRCSLIMADGNFRKSSIEKKLLVFPWVGVLGIFVILFGVYSMIKGIGRRLVSE